MRTSSTTDDMRHGEAWRPAIDPLQPPPPPPPGMADYYGTPGGSAPPPMPPPEFFPPGYEIPPGNNPDPAGLDPSAPAAGPMCACGVPSQQAISRTERNPDRPFWRCPDNGCDFFEWADAGASWGSAPVNEGATNGGGGGGAFGGSTFGNSNDLNGETFLDVDLGRMRSVRVRTFSGRVLVDIREFYEARNGGPGMPALLPSKKGIALSLDQWRQLRTSFAEVDRAVEEALASVDVVEGPPIPRDDWVTPPPPPPLPSTAPPSPPTMQQQPPATGELPSWFDELSGAATPSPPNMPKVDNDVPF